MTGAVGVRQIHTDASPGKEPLFGQGFVRLQLLFFFSRQMGEKFFSQPARSFERDYAHGFVGLCVDKGRGELAEIAMLERPSAQPAASDRVDGVGGAAVDLDENDKAFAVLRIFYAEQNASSPGHT